MDQTELEARLMESEQNAQHALEAALGKLEKMLDTGAVIEFTRYTSGDVHGTSCTVSRYGDSDSSFGATAEEALEAASERITFDDQRFRAMAAEERVYEYVRACNRLGYEPGRRMIARWTDLSEHKVRAALKTLQSNERIQQNGKVGRDSGFKALR
jgi:hypothetical protein